MTTTVTIDDLLDEWASEEHSCPVCGLDMEWEDCWNGCDDGYFDNDEFDEDDDFEICSVCHGHSGWWVCSSENCKKGKS